MMKTKKHTWFHGSHIINGHKAAGHSMQYMVSLQSNGDHVCGGFLISENIVVTAAHCSMPKPDLVVVGNQDIKSSNIKKINIEYTCKCPTYQKCNGNDIMILKLSEKVPMNNRVKTIPIPASDIILNDNQKCLVAGWGKTENDIFSDDLRVVNVSIINQQICQNQWDNTLPPNVICAGGYGTNKGFCQGDSGGPLVCNGIAVGVVSFNRRANCNYPDVPNVYTDISKYLPWINRNMKSRNCVR
ncbi:LOW QUALITY PROTEIN: mast cell protease 1A-like [Anableps anableps]